VAEILVADGLEDQDQIGEVVLVQVVLELKKLFNYD
jgi:hypothetical protein